MEHPDVQYRSIPGGYWVRVIGHGEAIFARIEDAERYVAMTSFYARTANRERRWGQD